MEVTEKKTHQENHIMENDEETKKRSHVNDNNTKDNWTASEIVTTTTTENSSPFTFNDSGISSPLPSPNSISRAANVSHVQFLPKFEDLSAATKSILQTFDLNAMPTTKRELNQLLQKINKAEELPIPPKPQPPTLKKNQSVETKVLKIQKFIESYEYNHTDRFSYYDVKKTQGLYRICRTSKDIILQALPIKCIEAVFLGVFFTNDMQNVTRIPVAFRSKVGDNFFEHIILAVKNNKNGKWGAIGLSRKNTLMYKPLKFETLGNLLTDYKNAYEECFHTLYYVYLGLPFGRDMYSQDEIQWRVLKLNVTVGWPAIVSNANKFENDSIALFNTYVSSGKLPKNFNSKYGNHVKKKNGYTSNNNNNNSNNNKSNNNNKKKKDDKNNKTSSKQSNKKSPTKKKRKKKKKSNSVKKTVAKKLAAAIWATSADDGDDNYNNSGTVIAEEESPQKYQ